MKMMKGIVMLARLTLLSLLATPLLLSAEPEPFPLKPIEIPKQSPEWIREIVTEADFEFADRARVVADSLAIDRDNKYSLLQKAHAKRMLFFDAQYGNRKTEAASYLSDLFFHDKDNEDYAFRILTQKPITTSEDAQKLSEELEKYLNAHPNYPPAIHAQCVILNHLSKSKEALAIIEGAIRHNPHNGLLYASKSNIHLKLEQHEEALKCNNRALSCSPPIKQIHMVYIYRGRILHAMGKYSEAISVANTAFRMLPSIDQNELKAQVFAIIAKCYLAIGKNELGFIMAKGMTEVAPHLSESWYLLALACTETARFSEGQKAIDEYSKKNNKNDTYYKLCLSLQMARGNYGEGVKLATEALAKYPADEQIKYYLAYALLATDDSNNLKLAKPIIDEAIKNQLTDRSKWHFLEAMAHSRHAEFDLAAKSLGNVIQAGHHSNSDQLIKMAKSTIAEKKPISIPLVKEYTSPQLHPDLILNLNQEADFEFIPDQIVEAQAMAKIENKNLEPAERLRACEVYMHYAKKKHNDVEVKKTLEVLTAAMPKDPYYRREQAVQSVKNFPFTDQWIILKKFCDEFPEDKEGMGLLALTLNNIGFHDKATEVADKLLRLDPHHPRGLNAKMLIEMRLGHFEKALDYANQMICQPDELLRHIMIYLDRARILLELNRSDEALANLAVVKRMMADPKITQEINTLAARAFKQQKKLTLAEQVLTAK